jgi:hypothetical protein
MKREVGPEIAEDGKGCATTPTGNESSLLKKKSTPGQNLTRHF